MILNRLRLFLIIILGFGNTNKTNKGEYDELNYSCHSLLFVLFVFLGFGVVGLLWGEGKSWWDDNWTYRRTLTVTERVRGARADLVAVANIPTLGKVNPNGSDLRVIDRFDKEVNMQILSTGFEDRALLAFEAPYRGDYTLYFGNPKATAPKQEPMDVGLMLEVRELTTTDTAGHAMAEPKDWPSMQALLENSTKVTGRWTVPSIAVGFNPLGRWNNGIFIFTGFLNCPVDGTYWFDSNSIDASFLLIDGKVITSWPGWHSADNWVSHKNGAHLQAGTHRLEYVNAFRNHGACVAGWRKPQSVLESSISENDFTGYYVAQNKPAETKTGPVADFQWDFDYDLGYEARQVTEVKFTPIAKGKVYHWDFGDGITSTEEAPNHVYLDSDTYNVTYSIDGQSVTQKVRVQPTRGHPWNEYDRYIKEFGDKIQNYSTAGLTASACFEMGYISFEIGQMEAAIRGFRAALNKGYQPQDRKEVNSLLQLYKLYRDRDKYDDAVWVCDYAYDNAPNNVTAVMALEMKAAILYDFQNKLNEAEACCKMIMAKYPKARTDYVRLASIHLGEYAALRGDKQAADKILTEAQNSDKWQGDIELSQGSHMINFEEYMRQNDFESAEQEIKAIIWTKPTDILTGLPRHLQGRLFLAMKKYALAIQDFDRAVTINPAASFMDELLYWKGLSYEALNQPDKAKECFEKLVKEFPESKLSSLAEKKLK